MPASLRAGAVEFLATTRIGEKGQLTVPKQFREDLGLGAGSPFTVLRIGDGLILLPEQRRFEQLCRRVALAFSQKGVGPEALLAALPKARRRVFTRRYRALASKLAGSRGRKGAPKR